MLEPAGELQLGQRWEESWIWWLVPWCTSVLSFEIWEWTWEEGGNYLSLWMSISVSFPSPIQLSLSLSPSLAVCLSLPLLLSIVLSKFFLFFLLCSLREWHAEWHQAKSGWNSGIKNSLSVMAAYSIDNNWCARIK